MEREKIWCRLQTRGLKNNISSKLFVFTFFMFMVVIPNGFSFLNVHFFIYFFVIFKCIVF